VKAKTCIHSVVSDAVFTIIMAYEITKEALAHSPRGVSRE